MPVNQIAYVELPSKDIVRSKQFYASLFGWSYQDFGPDYAAIHGSGVEAGLNAGTGTGQDLRTAAPLVIVETDAIEEMQQQVEAAGGTITEPLFSFPGGRRFHFLDPEGNELAILQPDR